MTPALHRVPRRRAPRSHPGISATPLYPETLGLVVTAEDGGPDAGLPLLPVRDLAARRLALPSGDFPTPGHIDDYLAAHGIRPHTAVEANSAQALTEIVRRTSLATVLPNAVTLLHRESAQESAASRTFTESAARLVRTRGYPRPTGWPGGRPSAWRAQRGA
ncbi:LysR substrate-binding domain-containing protein [Streptomyces virginiae]|uniref:LysR substrate-binding domain-containing protein n=1 Tax=Streptomyces virginiae TaxID=1961 RepID=UPI0036E048E3